MPRKSKHYSPTQKQNERVSQIYDELRAIPRNRSNPLHFKVFCWTLSEHQRIIYAILYRLVLLQCCCTEKKTQAVKGNGGIYEADGSLRSSIDTTGKGDNKNIGAYMEPGPRTSIDFRRGRLEDWSPRPNLWEYCLRNIFELYNLNYSQTTFCLP